jgi:hypothetical protein
MLSDYVLSAAATPLISGVERRGLELKGEPI